MSFLGVPALSVYENSWFVSDLHWLSRRSNAESWLPQIKSAIQQSHTFILGGDIFDFRWRTQRSLDAAMQASRDWLRRLIDTNTACRFHYLLGNHDCHPDFVATLQRLAQEFPQFSWHRHLLRIDNSIFLHGDIVDTPFSNTPDPDRLLDARRLAGEERPPPNLFSHVMYDAAVKARLHRLVVRFAKPRWQVLERLTRYLQAHGHTPDSGLEHVYFGHTHRRLDQFQYEGLTFSNPGAAIKGLPFQPLSPRLSPDAEVQAPSRLILPSLDELDAANRASPSAAWPPFSRRAKS